MGSAIRFSPDLSAWIVHNLDQGAPASALVNAMQQQDMAPQLAHAIVDAFVTARRMGQPVPVDSIEVQEPVPEFVYETPILRPGSAIQTSERLVRVAARAQRPMLAVLNNVLSADDCAELIALARPRLTPSTIVDPKTGRDVVAGNRSSFGMFFRLQENPFIARLDKHFSEIMNLPLENGEGIQILHYPQTAQSTPHFDFLVPSNAANTASIARSGQRVSTMVTYLNEVEEGGETVFPAVGWSVTPLRGNAVYFEYCNGSNQVDHASLHASNPITRGEKWVATKWMRQRKFIPAQG